MLSKHLFEEPTPPGGVRPSEQELPGDLSSTMSKLTYLLNDCSPAHAPRGAALVVPHVLLEQCSPGQALQ
jgi:hypothetical protein